MTASTTVRLILSSCWIQDAFSCCVFAFKRIQCVLCALIRFARLLSLTDGIFLCLSARLNSAWTMTRLWMHVNAHFISTHYLICIRKGQIVVAIERMKRSTFSMTVLRTKKSAKEPEWHHEPSHIVVNFNCILPTDYRILFHFSIKKNLISLCRSLRSTVVNEKAADQMQKEICKTINENRLHVSVYLKWRNANGEMKDCKKEAKKELHLWNTMIDTSERAYSFVVAIAHSRLSCGTHFSSFIRRHFRHCSTISSFAEFFSSAISHRFHMKKLLNERICTGKFKIENE